MKASEAIIAWTPADTTNLETCGQVKVGPLINVNARDWTKPYSCTGGAAYMDRRKMTGWKSIAAVFIDFHNLVVHEGISPEVAHKAFLAIDEYAEAVLSDALVE